jgi:hypothetical protein
MVVEEEEKCRGQLEFLHWRKLRLGFHPTGKQEDAAFQADYEAIPRHEILLRKKCL